MSDQTQHTPGPWEWPETDDANDRLRAAAPDLLAALKAMVAYPSSGSARRQAEAAIAKAEGRS